MSTKLNLRLLNVIILIVSLIYSLWFIWVVKPTIVPEDVTLAELIYAIAVIAFGYNLKEVMPSKLTKIFYIINLVLGIWGLLAMGLVMLSNTFG